MSNPIKKELDRISIVKDISEREKIIEHFQTTGFIDRKPDYDKMGLIISAIHKLVIKDVVKYSDAKINATKKVVSGE